MKRLFVVAVVLMLVVMANGAFSATQTVLMHDNHFEPVSITIQVGDSIEFDNVGRAPHTATMKDGSWDTGNMNAGEKKTITFSQPGSFDYICTYHEALGMVGTVVVEGEAAAQSPASAPTEPASQLGGHYGPLIFATAGILFSIALGGYFLFGPGKKRS